MIGSHAAGFRASKFRKYGADHDVFDFGRVEVGVFFEGGFEDLKRV
jgi:hypothetical protein